MYVSIQGLSYGAFFISLFAALPCRRAVLYVLISGLILLPGAVKVACAAPVVEVSVSGVEGAVRENVLASLGIERQKNSPNLTGRLIRSLHEKAPDEISSALQPFGYYKPSIKSWLIQQDGTWLAGYVIKPGEPVRVDAVHLIISGAGSEEARLKKIQGNFPLKKGDALEHERYEKAKRDLLEAATEQGYLDAHFIAHKVTVHLEQYFATINLHLDTGPLYRFGDVTFKQDVLKTELLGRFVPFKKGDPYQVSKLMDLQNVLYGSDYFSQVEVRPRRDMAEGLDIPVEVDLVSKKRQKYTIGLGYGTDTGIRTVLGWENRRVNRSGHRFSTDLRLSQIQKNFSSRYIIPMRNPATDHLDFTAGLFHEDTNIYKSETRLVGAGYIHMRGTWQETFYINVQKEKYDVGGETDDARLILPGVSWTRIKANDRIFTTHGSRIALDLKGAHTAVGSSASFIQARLNGKFIRRPWDTGKIILRGDFGFTDVVKLSELPASQRFFAGGDQSVRGYGYKTLGPVNKQGDVTGGKHLIVGSVEYEQRIYGKWGAAVFYDAGNALNKLSDPLKQGAGIGVRWRSPVGPVRVDFAWALSEKTGRRWRIHLNMGPDL